MFDFTLKAQDGQARIGEFTTPHGVLETPMFMPVGTHGAVKGVSPFELEQAGSQIILSNTYHLYLRPGEGIVQGLGGLHAFMGWQHPILTDSGGFQVFSLGERGMQGSEKKALRSVSEEGITFQSHLDGSRHLFTPEKSIQVQQALGADIIMAFDQPVYGMSAKEAAGEAMRRSARWLERSKAQWQEGSDQQALFGIVQGGTYTDLHRESAEFVAAQDLPGNAIGGLSVGEEKGEMWCAVESIVSLLPESKPRYFMGLGEPRDLVEATVRGVDMYDCVAPSRLARHAAVWQVEGSESIVHAFYSGNTEKLLSLGEQINFCRLNLHNAQYERDNHSFLKSEAPFAADLKGFSYAALHHYLKEQEMLGFRILTLHNIHILHLITQHMKQAIQAGSLGALAQLLK